MHWVLPFCPWFCLHDFCFSQFVLSFFVIFKSGFFVYCVWLEFSLQVCPVKRWAKVVKILSQFYLLAWGCLRAFLFFCTAEYYGLCCRCVDEHLGLTVFHVLNQNLVYWIDAPHFRVFMRYMTICFQVQHLIHWRRSSDDITGAEWMVLPVFWCLP